MLTISIDELEHMEDLPSVIFLEAMDPAGKGTVVRDSGYW